MNNTMIYVVVWKWADNSASGIVKAYYYEDEAKSALGMLNEYSDRFFEIKEVELI